MTTHRSRNTHSRSFSSRLWRRTHVFASGTAARYWYGFSVMSLLVVYLIQSNATVTGALRVREQIKQRDTLREQVADLETKLLAIKDPAVIVAVAQSMDLNTTVTTHQLIPTGLASR